MREGFHRNFIKIQNPTHDLILERLSLKFSRRFISGFDVAAAGPEELIRNGDK